MPPWPHRRIGRPAPRALREGLVAGSHCDPVDHVGWRLHAVQACSSVPLAVVSRRNDEKHVFLPRQPVKLTCPPIGLHIVLDGNRGADAEIDDATVPACNRLFDAVQNPVALKIPLRMRGRKHAIAFNGQRRRRSPLPWADEAIENGSGHARAVIKAFLLWGLRSQVIIGDVKERAVGRFGGVDSAVEDGH